MRVMAHRRGPADHACESQWAHSTLRPGIAGISQVFAHDICDKLIEFLHEVRRPMEFDTGSRFFEVQTLKGRWQFSEIELGIDGEDVVRLTVCSPAIIHPGEMDLMIEEALDRCFDRRDELMNTHASHFDAVEFMTQELSAFGLHVMPSCPEVWGAVQPSSMLQ